MIRRAAAWLAVRAAARDRADAVRESTTLHTEILLAAVRAGAARCHEHPDATAVNVVKRDGVPVAVCAYCMCLAGTPRQPKHRAVAAA